ncbi:hypothetical protein Nmel_014320 [Mimus melanotis]
MLWSGRRHGWSLVSAPGPAGSKPRRRHGNGQFPVHRVSAPPLRVPGTMVPWGAVTARGQHVPFKSGAAMICLVLGLFAGLFHSAFSGVNERTFVAIKPDGVQRRLVGEIIRRFERKGLQLVGMKLLQVSGRARPGWGSLEPRSPCSPPSPGCAGNCWGVLIWPVQPAGVIPAPNPHSSEESWHWEG